MKDTALRPAARHERQFYAANRAFGRFGMRIFTPAVMDQPHWHGHVEANFPLDHALVYEIEGQEVVVPPRRLAVFWAGITHRLTAIRPEGPEPRLINLYLPLDAFLSMPHVAPLQEALLGGDLVLMPGDLCDEALMRRWNEDYRSGDFERSEILKAELNTLFRRACLTPTATPSGRTLSSAQVRHVIAMLRQVLENLDRPLKNREITAVTGLHENYALGLFSQVMRCPLGQFVLRMRLMRARALLLESSLAIASVIEAAGFSSTSQFYHQFKAAYGLSPHALRRQYLGAAR